MATTITTRVEDVIVKDIDAVATEEALDRSAVIRRFLIKAVKEWKIQKYLAEYETGRMSLGYAARKCNLTLWEMVDEVKKRMIKVPYTIEDFKEDIKVL